jgi:hypothetical protein
MLSGIVLVSMQFGCVRAQTTTSAAGFTHAGRWPKPSEVISTDATSTEVASINWWVQPRKSAKPVAPALLQSASYTVESTTRATEQTE